MSILTKISVVVLVVLVLLACPVFITQATVVPNYRLAYERELQSSALAKMDAMSEKLAHSKTITERDSAITAANKLQVEKQKETERLSFELAGWRTKFAEQQNNFSRLAADVAALQREAVNFNTRNDLLSSQLADARKEIDTLTKEGIRLSDLLKQAEAEKDRLDKIAKVRYERVRELEEDNEQLRASGATVKTGEDVIAPIAGKAIIGTVTAVTGDYASINIGSAKGIKRGMKLIIYRGARLVAFLRVEEVEIDQAAGIVIDRQLDPMQNDKVTTSLMK